MGATFTVINTNSIGPGSLFDAINQALYLNQTNASSGTNIIPIIQFNIPGPGPHSIKPTFWPYGMNYPLIVDGTTQPGYSGRPLIELDGSNTGLGPNFGFTLWGGNSIVRGLAIHSFTAGGISISSKGSNRVEACYIGTDASGTNRMGFGFAAKGIVIGSSGNKIGGTEPGKGNVIVGASDGLLIFRNDNVVQGNLIGTDATGRIGLRNGTGINILGFNNIIGGTDAGARNVIAASYEYAGIWIYNGDGCPDYCSGFNIVQGNFIGTDVTGTNALPNVTGIWINGAYGNLIGGAEPGARNVISGNKYDGIVIGRFWQDPPAPSQQNLVFGNYIGVDATGLRPLGNGTAGVNISASFDNFVGSGQPGAGNVVSCNGLGVLVWNNASYNVVQGNSIGTDASGTTALGNFGPGVSIGANNTIIGGAGSGEGNAIAFNGDAGIWVAKGARNSLVGNAIHRNGTFGIDLAPEGAATNDVNDLDSGPNNLQNFPVLTSALTNVSGVRIAGVLNSTPDKSFQVQCFANTMCNATGYGEGEIFLTETNVTTDSSGSVAFQIHLPDGLPPGHRFIAATATDPDGNTSEFSACLTVQATNPPVILFQPLSQNVAVGANATLTVFAGGSPPPSYQWIFNGVVLPNQTNASLKLIGVSTNDAGSYQAIVQNSSGSVTSSVALVNVGLIPTLDSAPLSQDIVLGSNVTFAVVASGTLPLRYQWQFKGNNLPNQTNAALNLTGVSTNNAGSYRVIVDNAFGSVTSAEAILNVLFPPFIVVQPLNQNIAIGANATITALALGNPTPAYQWLLNDVHLANQTNASLFLPNVTTNNAGDSGGPQISDQ